MRRRENKQSFCHGWTRIHTDKQFVLSVCIRVHPWLDLSFTRRSAGLCPAVVNFRREQSHGSKVG